MNALLVAALNRWSHASLLAERYGPYLEAHWDWLVYSLLTLWFIVTVGHQFLFIPFTQALQRWDVCWVVPCYRLFEKPSSVQLFHRSSLSGDWLEYEIQRRNWRQFFWDPSFFRFDLTMTLCSRVVTRNNRPGLNDSYPYKALSRMLAKLPQKPVQFAIWQNGRQAFLSPLMVDDRND